MRSWKGFLMAVVLLAYAMPVAAEFYRYVDKFGNVMFTDDLSKVPPEQRTNVQSYTESRSASKPAETKKAPDSAATAAQLEGERQKLLEKDKALSQEYDKLMAERAILNEQGKVAVTNAQIKSHNEKIVEFNARIQAYEEKRNAYDSELKAFNERAEAFKTENHKNQ
jgi:chromosome segregation ATPase